MLQSCAQSYMARCRHCTHFAAPPPPVASSGGRLVPSSGWPHALGRGTTGGCGALGRGLPRWGGTCRPRPLVGWQPARAGDGGWRKGCRARGHHQQQVGVAGRGVDAAAIPLEVGVCGGARGGMGGIAAELVSATSRTDVGSTTQVTWRHMSAHYWTYTAWPIWDCGECTASTWCLPQDVRTSMSRAFLSPWSHWSVALVAMPSRTPMSTYPTAIACKEALRVRYLHCFVVSHICLMRFVCGFRTPRTNMAADPPTFMSTDCRNSGVGYLLPVLCCERSGAVLFPLYSCAAFSNL